MADDEEARKKRAEQLRKKIRQLTSDQDADPSPEPRPGESDAEYVHRRMREIERKAPKKSS